MFGTPVETVAIFSIDTHVVLQITNEHMKDREAKFPQTFAAYIGETSRRVRLRLDRGLALELSSRRLL